MSTFKSVFEHMKTASSKLNHEALWRAKLKGEAEGEAKMEEMYAKEIESLCQTERNILSGCDIPVKFSQAHVMTKGFNLDVTAVAKCDQLGKAEIVHGSERRLQPASDVQWYLAPTWCKLTYPEKNDALIARNREVIGQLMSSCTNLGEKEASDLAITLAAERLHTANNMEHMLTKMYLMLCDLTLAETAGSKEWEYVVGAKIVTHENLTPSQIIGQIVSKEVVVDSAGFDNEELEMLWLSAQAYPPVKFSGDNVYNAINMAEDSVAIISKTNIKLKHKMDWDPQTMYRSIASLCCKLDCVQQWYKVVSRMRGVPLLMRDVMQSDKVQSVWSGMQLSCNYKRALGGDANWGRLAKQFPAYICTSLALVVDLMLGETLRLTATTVVEQIGGYGNLMIPKKDTSSMEYDSLMRDYNIAGSCEETNALLLAWNHVKEQQLGFGFGTSLKSYFVRVTREMRAQKFDVIQQLMFDISYVPVNQCTWSALRGVIDHDGIDLNATNDARDEKDRRLVALAWAMGARDHRPHLFVNRDKRGEDVLSSTDRKLLSGTTGRVYLSWMTYNLAEQFEARQDAGETESTDLIATMLRGARCAVHTKDGVTWEVKTMVPPESAEGIVETLGYSKEQVREVQVTYDDIEPITAGGAKVIRPAKKADEVYKGNEVKQLKLNKAPRWVEYDIVDPGYHKHMLGVKRPEPPQESSGLVRMSRIETPGDGKCGIHAIANHLAVQGAIKQDDVRGAFDMLNDMAGQSTWHEDGVLAALCSNLGYGLDMYVRTGENAVALARYDKEKLDRVEVMHNNGHYETVVTSKDGIQYKIDTMVDMEPEFSRLETLNWRERFAK